jgi:hypothetical protein
LKKTAQARESRVPFRETKLFALEEDSARFLSAYPNDTMFAKVKGEVACKRLFAGALAESPSFRKEAQSANNWIVVTD